MVYRRLSMQQYSSHEQEQASTWVRSRWFHTPTAVSGGYASELELEVSDSVS